MDIRQTPEYAKYLNFLGWKTAKVNDGQIFIKRFPLIGSIIKVQRIHPPIPFGEIEKIAKENRTFLIQIDQELEQSGRVEEWKSRKTEPWKEYGYKINKTPYFPTKTIHIDLTQSEQNIFNSFSEAKRRAVRRAQKNNIIIKEAQDYQEFLWLKKRSLWEKPVIPIATGHEIGNLYKAFCPKNAKILIAYYQEKPVAGIFLLHTSKVAYYWLAAATNQGKKLFAPTMLVWEALKRAKKIGCQIFDFEGVYDERFPVKSWFGFTKFKEGFGGKEILYPPSLIKTKLSPRLPR